MIRALGVAAGVLACACSALAGMILPETIEQTRSFSEVFQGDSGGLDRVTFEPFDNNDGRRELVGVELAINATARLDAALENRSASPTGNVVIDFGPVLNVVIDVGHATAFGSLFIVGEPIFAGPLDLPATDGVAFSGPDALFFEALALAIDASHPIMPGGGLPDLYERLTESDEVVVELSSANRLTYPEGFAPGTALARRVTDFSTSGEVTLTYLFVPSPGAAVLCGVGAFVVMVRRLTRRS